MRKAKRRPISEFFMDKNLEALFVKKYVKRNRQDRLLHELTNGKKRARALDRFNHSTEDIIEQTKIVELILDDKTLDKYLKDENAYIVSTRHINGLFLSKDDIKKCLYEEFGAIIVCATEYSFIKTEGFAFNSKLYVLK